MSFNLDHRITVGLFVWVLVVSGGLYHVFRYETTPGKKLASPSRFPGGTGLVTHQDFHTIVMLVHPHCPCSRASVAELKTIATRFKNTVRGYVLFYLPPTHGEAWVKTEMWQNLESLIGFKRVIDRSGRFAKLFGASTSGHTLLYGRDGVLLFSGGITPSRGHVGENVGSNIVSSLLSGESPALRETLVFGCHLFDPQEKAGSKAENI